MHACPQAAHHHMQLLVAAVIHWDPVMQTDHDHCHWYEHQEADQTRYGLHAAQESGQELKQTCRKPTKACKLYQAWTRTMPKYAPTAAILKLLFCLCKQ